ncbi:hypothetical protein H4I95_05117 [Botrytis cinerea]
MGLRPYINLAVEPAPAAPVLAPGLPAGPRPGVSCSCPYTGAPSWYYLAKNQQQRYPKNYVQGEYDLLPGGVDFVGSRAWLLNSHPGAREKGTPWFLKASRPPKPKSKKGKKGPRPRQDCDGVNPPGDSDNQPAAKKRKGVRFPPIFMVLFGI